MIQIKNISDISKINDEVNKLDDSLSDNFDVDNFESVLKEANLLTTDLNSFSDTYHAKCSKQRDKKLSVIRINKEILQGKINNLELLLNGSDVNLEEFNELKTTYQSMIDLANGLENGKAINKTN